MAPAWRLEAAYDRLAHQHPLIVHALRTGDVGRRLRNCDVPGGALFTESELYRQLYEPFDIRYQLVVQLPAPPHVVVGYALNRPEAHCEFSDRDVAVLEALVAPVAMHHRVLMTMEQSEAMVDEADRDGGAVVTPRQSEVASALALTGGTNTQLARHLGMSEGTVKKHLEAVYRLLDVDSRARAVVAFQALSGG